MPHFLSRYTYVATKGLERREGVIRLLLKVFENPPRSALVDYVECRIIVGHCGALGHGLGVQLTNLCLGGFEIGRICPPPEPTYSMSRKSTQKACPFQRNRARWYRHIPLR